VAFLLLLVLAAGGVGGYLVLTGSDDDETSAVRDKDTDRAEQTSTLAGSPTSEPTSEPSEEPTSEPTEETEPPEVTPPVFQLDVQCWRGGPRVARLSDCLPTPSGRRGLAWVFPDIDFTRCAPEPATKRLILNCIFGGVEYNFSEWSSNRAGTKHYDDSMGVSSYPFSGARERWDRPTLTSDGRWKSAIMYVGERWSVTVYAFETATRDAAVTTLTMRPVRDLLGVSR